LLARQMQPKAAITALRSAIEPFRAIFRQIGDSRYAANRLRS